jgi:serine/threonine protein kinase
MILKTLKHPHIIELHEMIETPQSIYLIMEFAAGGELFNYIIEKRKLPEQEAAKLYY